MIKQPQKKLGMTGTVRGPLTSTVNKTGPKSLTPGPMKLPSKKSENMGYDPSVPLVNSSKTGWAKPTQPAAAAAAAASPASPPPEEASSPKEAEEAPLPTSSVWGRKTPAASDWPRADAARDAEFPPPGTKSPPVSTSPMLSPKETPVKAQDPMQKSDSTSQPNKKSSTMDWALDDANAEMDFNQPLFAGKLPGKGLGSRGPTSTTSGRGNSPQPTYSMQDNRGSSAGEDNRRSPLGPPPVGGPGQTGPRVLQSVPAARPKGNAWGNAASNAEPQQSLAEIQEMEQRQARERLAAEREQQRQMQEERDRRVNDHKNRQLREEEAKERLAAIRDQKATMTQKTQQATEKRRQESEQEEAERKSRLQSKLLELERKAAEEREAKEREKAEADKAEREKREAELEVRRRADAERERERKAREDARQILRRPPQDEAGPNGTHTNPWQKRMEHQGPSLLLSREEQEAESSSHGKGGKGDHGGRAGDYGRGRGRGRGRRGDMDDPDYDRSLFGSRYKVGGRPEEDNIGPLLEEMGVRRPEHEYNDNPQWGSPHSGDGPRHSGRGKGDRERSYEERGKGYGKGKGEGKGRGYGRGEERGDRDRYAQSGPSVDWSMARTMERSVQQDLEKPSEDAEGRRPSHSEEMQGKGRSRGKGAGRGRDGGGRGLWEDEDDTYRGLRGVRGAKGQVSGKGRGKRGEYHIEENMTYPEEFFSDDSEQEEQRMIMAAAAKSLGRRRKVMIPRGVVPMIIDPAPIMAASGAMGRGAGIRVKMVNLTENVHRFEFDDY